MPKPSKSHRGIAIALLAAFSTATQADRYGAYDNIDLEYDSYGPDPSILTYIAGLVLSFIAWRHFISLWASWIKRKKTGERPEQLDGFLDWDFSHCERRNHLDFSDLPYSSSIAGVGSF
ncbi:hypothetical protein [Pollutimonas sp. M17]|uniref:hypothetical protein n=1 Tax=Pollutimonas sp. M17 TaxID=2962065 RepID=UPI0021F462AF|nr:hypothetical protein [Pollutimonas sp. M17]UYO95044.1 hypothetical protein OEG81_06980 [Pollutimonas sp. M17]